MAKSINTVTDYIYTQPTSISRKERKRKIMISPNNFIDFLKQRHEHPRDKYLLFEEKWHKYTITNDPVSRYTSVTKVVHAQFPKFDADLVIKKMMAGKNWNEDNKYWNMTPDEIKSLWNNNGKAVSGAGTDLHFNIEQFMNQWLVDEDDAFIDCDHEMLLDCYHEDMAADDCVIKNDSEEWKYFLSFVNDHRNFKPYRTEWMVYDERLKIAGSIDMVYQNPDGSVDIYDWKRAKEINVTNNFGETGVSMALSHIPNTNFWHYSLQLNIYKAILERNYGVRVRDLYLVQLHPESGTNNYRLFPCADLAKEVEKLFNGIAAASKSVRK